MAGNHSHYGPLAGWRWRRALAVLAAVAAACRGPQPSPAGNQAPAPVGPSPVPRAFRSLPDPAFRVEWIGNDVPGEMTAGEDRTVRVTFKNASPLPWPDPDSTSYEPPQAGAVRLACRWWPGSAPGPTAYGRRADLDRLLWPGQSVTLAVPLTAPPKPGAYRLQCDLVQERVAYFEDKGAARLMVPVQVR